MRTRHSQRHFDLGEAISMEDAISMMTIIFVLFVIFLVPLVSIDKARLEKKQEDHFWGEVVAFLGTKSSPAFDKYSSMYRNAFDLYNPLFVKTTHRESSKAKYRYIELLSQDSSLVVIRHELNNNDFHSMRMTKNGETTIYQHGILQRVDKTSEWFSMDEVLDYGEDPRSKQLNSEYRHWRNRSMKGSE